MPMQSILKNLWFRYIALASIIGFILYSLYQPITWGLDIEDLTVLLVPCIVGLTMFQWLTKRSLLHIEYLPHLLVGTAWALSYPLLFEASYTKALYFYEFAPEYLFGLTIFLFLTLSQLLLKNIFKPRVLATTYSLLDTLLLIIPAGQLAYFFYIGHCITPASLMALYMSNPQESYEYVLNGIGMLGILGSVFFLLGITYSFYRLNNRLSMLPLKFTSTPVMSVVTLCIGIYSFAYLFPHTNIVTHWIGIREYMHEIQQYNEKHSAIYEDVNIINKETAAVKTPGTIILVIGESASRNFMKAFNPHAPYENTPWESSNLKNKNFFFFPHAYSSYVQTVPTLERALTERNQYDDREFLTTASILDIAKKAGYNTYWFSNQGVYGEYDTTTSLIAKQADVATWAHQSFEFSDKYDEALLPLLKTVPPNNNNFVVLHIMGSHIYYNDRYPSKFSIFKKTNPPTGLEAYANSILYTDWLLSEIFNYGKEHLNLQAMIYFSDHGESIETSHNPDIFDFNMTRIPFWTYLSPEYQQAFPETVTTLRSRHNDYFTNDLLYDYLSGILQAPSNRYDAGRDFSNPAYRFHVNNLTTMLGTRSISEDPEI